MRARWAVALLCAALAGGTGCGDDGGTAATPTLFSGQYTLASEVQTDQTLVSALGALSTDGEEHRWEAVATATASGTPVARLFSELDAEFLGDTTGEGMYTLTATLRRGVARGRAAGSSEVETEAAGETCQKTVLVAQHLAMVRALRQAQAAITAGDWTAARASWDRAAVYFSGLEARYRSRSSTAVTDFWGAGRNALTDENLADRTIELLSRGAQLLSARATDNALATTRRLEVYSNKYFFLSAVNYGNVFQTRVATMGDLEYPRAEGRAFFEGVVLPFHGRATAGSPAATLVTAARSRWERSGTDGPTKATVLLDAVGLYAQVTAPAMAGYASLPVTERAALRARLIGLVDLLDEALTARGQDPDRLRAALATATDQSDATAMLPVQQALEALARPEGGR